MLKVLNGTIDAKLLFQEFSRLITLIIIFYTATLGLSDEAQKIGKVRKLLLTFCFPLSPRTTFSIASKSSLVILHSELRTDSSSIVQFRAEDMQSFKETETGLY